ncbi:MAG: hypothetical protein Q8Q14_15500 [Gemmatimonadales bacterium]|nr:hypothetical protein [Gemmatimonadales bacterium]
MLTPAADAAIGQWVGMGWPWRRVAFGVAVAVQELAGADGRFPDERHALRYARRAMEWAQEHEWLPGAERSDKGSPTAPSRPARGRRGPDNPAARITQAWAEFRDNWGDPEPDPTAGEDVDWEALARGGDT